MLRPLLILISVALCLALLTLVWRQNRQQIALSEEQRLLVTQASAPSQTEPPETSSVGTTVVAPPQSPSLELLRLRGEVGLLERRKRELTSVLPENDRLRRELANPGMRTTNSMSLPPDYLRKATAQFAGYGTPEATLQSLLWALQNQDFTNFFAAFTPEVAERMSREMQRVGHSPADFMSKAAALPGMRVVGKEERPDGEILLRVEIVPGEHVETIHFQLVNGEWKMATH